MGGCDHLQAVIVDSRESQKREERGREMVGETGRVGNWRGDCKTIMERFGDSAMALTPGKRNKPTPIAYPRPA